MKKTMFSIAMLFSLFSFAQSKPDSSKVKQDSVQQVFYVLLTESEYGQLVNIVKTADMKPSEINNVIIFLNSRRQPLLQPKEQPKKK